jgi:hypothetical protein
LLFDIPFGQFNLPLVAYENYWLAYAAVRLEALFGEFREAARQQEIDLVGGDREPDRILAGPPAAPGLAHALGRRSLHLPSGSFSASRMISSWRRPLHRSRGGHRVADAEAEGELTLTGDRQLFDRFVTWFPLPEKIG